MKVTPSTPLVRVRRPTSRRLPRPVRMRLRERHQARTSRLRGRRCRPSATAATIWRTARPKTRLPSRGRLGTVLVNGPDSPDRPAPGGHAGTRRLGHGSPRHALRRTAPQARHRSAPRRPRRTRMSRCLPRRARSRSGRRRGPTTPARHRGKGPFSAPRRTCSEDILASAQALRCRRGRALDNDGRALAAGQRGWRSAVRASQAAGSFSSSVLGSVAGPCHARASARGPPSATTASQKLRPCSYWRIFIERPIRRSSTRQERPRVSRRRVIAARSCGSDGKHSAPTTSIVCSAWPSISDMTACIRSTTCQRSSPSVRRSSSPRRARSTSSRTSPRSGSPRARRAKAPRRWRGQVLVERHRQPVDQLPDHALEVPAQPRARRRTAPRGSSRGSSPTERAARDRRPALRAV